VRFAIIGGIGIVINDAALVVFEAILGKSLNPVSTVLSFIVSNAINYILNQLITYPELKPATLIEWLVRLVKVQATSAVGLIIGAGISIVLANYLHLSGVITNPIGIIIVFVYKYLVSDRFVYVSKNTKVEPSAIETVGVSEPEVASESITGD
jgi:putative flippase GtrA